MVGGAEEIFCYVECSRSLLGLDDRKPRRDKKGKKTKKDVRYGWLAVMSYKWMLTQLINICGFRKNTAHGDAGRIVQRRREEIPSLAKR
jgi:hypothetical protein